MGVTMPFYTEPRWEEAPVGTTGFLPETERFWASWVKKIGDVVYTANAQHGPQEFEYDNKSCHQIWTSRRDMYIPRPEQERPEPDWSKAPEGTTGFTPNKNEPTGGNWTRVQNDVVLFWGNTKKEWLNTNFIDTPQWKEHKHLYIPRPSVQSVEPSAPVTEEFFPIYDWTAL